MYRFKRWGDLDDVAPENFFWYGDVVGLWKVLVEDCFWAGVVIVYEYQRFRNNENYYYHKFRIRRDKIYSQLSPNAFVVKASRTETMLACFSLRHPSIATIAASFKSRNPNFPFSLAAISA